MVTLSSLRRSVEAQQGTDGLDSAAVSAIAGSGVSVYETLDSLPATGLTAGDEAFVKGNNRLYVSNGSGWYNITLVNRNVRWDSGGEPDISYTITDSATPLIITARAIDSDNNNLINQSFVSDSAQYMVDITNDSSLFTFTPKSADSIGLEVGAGNLTDSNGDFTYTFKWSDGINFISKAVTIAYNVVGGSGITWGGDRVISSGGQTIGGSETNSAEYFDMVLSSSTTNFGNLAVNVREHRGCSNTTRNVIFGGDEGSTPYSNRIQYFTFASTGNSLDFGDISHGAYNPSAMSDGTYGITSGGYVQSGATNAIEYVTMDTTGNTADFGDLSGPYYNISGTSNTSRGLFFGGYRTDTNVHINNIEYIATATPGNTQDFGDMQYNSGRYGSVNDGTYAITGGGDENNDRRMQYVTIDTLGNAATFGNHFGATTQRKNLDGAENSTRAVWVSGQIDAVDNFSDQVEYITMATPGNASDLLNLAAGRRKVSTSGGNAA